ncbi:hypothetical protein ACFV2X_48080 [Streptomyces sp. NPDC059679]|uniref:hypothetical protein n=1 Tax=Streptomyces sp. NPDC059679 TaxID=3346903 RepID=UPI00368DC943
MMAITLAADGRGWVDGVLVATEPDSTLAETRAAALRQCAQVAQDKRRSVWVEATDPDGRAWALAVHPSGQVQDAAEAAELVADPDGEVTPKAYREQVAAAVEAVERGQEHVGMRLARSLETELVARYGAGHPYVWRAVELRAHAAFECSMPAAACELYLEAARGWAALDSDAYWGAAQRAYACWHRVTEQDRAVWLGEELEAALRLGGERARGAVRRVLRRVDEMQSGLVG